MDLANLQSLFLSVVSNSTLHLLCQRTAQRADKNPDSTTGIPNGKWLQEYAMQIAKAIGSALVLALLCWAAAAQRLPTAMCPAIFRVLNTCCDTAPGRPSHSSDSP